jgi:hypothetical protein
MPDLDGMAHTCKGAAWSAFTDRTHINLKGANAWAEFFERRWKFEIVKSFADGYYDFPYGSNRIGSLFGDLFRVMRTAIQFLFAIPLLRQGDGENVIFILKKPL